MGELLLWQWSTTVQITSAWMLMLFFWTVRRHTGRSDLDAWFGAWLANGIALGITCVYWLAQPPEWLLAPIAATYVGGKTAFVVLLLLGTLEFARGRRPSLRMPLLVVALAAAVSAPWLNGIPLLGMVQCVVIVLVLGVALFHCLRSSGLGLGWLGLGIALRLGLAAIEGVCYGMSYFLPEADVPERVRQVQAVHSSFDTGAEWMIALGCVLAYAHRVQQELSRSNAELRHAQQDVLEVAQRDPLTGIHNRRMLPQLFQEAVAKGGHLLFFDVDGLKAINDRDGHFAGDAMLQRFGEALREAFEGHPTLRYAGDEFIAMLPAGHDPAAAIADLRARLAATSVQEAIAFSVGTAALGPGVELRIALQEADAGMYRDKQGKAGIARAG